MTLIFNMDLDDLTKVTNYGFDRKEHPFPTFYFRLYQNGYDVDMSKFNRLTLRIRSVTTGKIDTFVTTTVATINDEKLVEVKLDDEYLGKNDTIHMTPTVRFSNKNILLNEFQFIIYEGSKTEMNMVKQELQHFNHLYNLYIKAIKRDQINQPHGVVGLDKDARMSIEQLPDVVGQHVQTRIRDSEIHGMRLNADFNLEIYDSIEKRYVLVNSISGGKFKVPHKDDADIFGGKFTEPKDESMSVAGGTFK